jgi:hypothetical protein
MKSDGSRGITMQEWLVQMGLERPKERPGLDPTQAAGGGGGGGGFVGGGRSLVRDGFQIASRSFKIIMSSS